MSGRHSWKLNDRGTGRCARCKIRVKFITRPKRKGDGKITRKLFTLTTGAQTEQQPYCEA